MMRKTKGDSWRSCQNSRQQDKGGAFCSPFFISHAVIFNLIQPYSTFTTLKQLTINKVENKSLMIETLSTTLNQLKYIILHPRLKENEK